jgi:hypothetical protein
MPESFEAGLRELAEHGQRAGRLDPAAVIRARADRRRKRRYAATGALGVALVAALGTGIAVAQPSPRPGPPAASSSSSAPAKQGGVLSGDRQVNFQVLDVGQPVPGAVLSIDSTDRSLQVAATTGDRALFVPTPAPAGHNQYLIKTGTLREAGAALCLSVRSNGANPLTVVTATCEPANNSQLFTFEQNGKDEQNRMNYGIATEGSVYLQWSPTGNSGLVAQETGGYLPDTTFVLVDRGPSTVPN